MLSLFPMRTHLSVIFAEEGKARERGKRRCARDRSSASAIARFALIRIDDLSRWSDDWHIFKREIISPAASGTEKRRGAPVAVRFSFRVSKSARNAFIFRSVVAKRYSFRGWRRAE
jgi:hypothetical protein